MTHFKYTFIFPEVKLGQIMTQNHQKRAQHTLPFRVGEINGRATTYRSITII